MELQNRRGSSSTEDCRLILRYLCSFVRHDVIVKISLNHGGIIGAKENGAKSRQAVEIKSLGEMRFAWVTKRRNLLTCPVSLTANPGHRSPE